MDLKSHLRSPSHCVIIKVEAARHIFYNTIKYAVMQDKQVLEEFCTAQRLYLAPRHCESLKL